MGYANQHQGMGYANQHQDIRYTDQYQGTKYADQHQGIGYANQHQGMGYTNQHQGIGYDNQHQGMANPSPSSFTGSSYSSSSRRPQQTTEHNDFYDELIELGTLHINYMHLEQMSRYIQFLSFEVHTIMQ